jgi:hypothetical protein
VEGPLVERVDEPVEGMGLEAEPVLLSPVEVGTESVEAHRVDARRRGQVHQEGDVLTVLPVGILLLSGEAHQEVPDGTDVVAQAVLQKPDVLARGRAFFISFSVAVARASIPGWMLVTPAWPDPRSRPLRSAFTS